MEHLDVFSVRDLRNKSGDLLRDTEAGQISLITKHGKPASLAVPFDERLIRVDQLRPPGSMYAKKC